MLNCLPGRSMLPGYESIPAAAELPCWTSPTCIVLRGAASIPVFSTGPALILVGALMMINVIKIPWEDILHAVPAFLTIVLMPLTYSIAYGMTSCLPAACYALAPTFSVMLTQYRHCYTGVQHMWRISQRACNFWVAYEALHYGDNIVSEQHSFCRV